MPISAAGSNRAPTLHRCAGRCPPRGLPRLGAARRRGFAPTLQRCVGFTLLELLLVVALIAMVAAGTSLALRDSAQSRLETEAMRLAALLDAARAQSRMLGVAVQWQPTERGFAWPGLNAAGSSALPTAWLDAATRSSSSNPILLGPEPVIAPASVTLVLATAPDKPVRIATDGVRPFAIQAAPERTP